VEAGVLVTANLVATVVRFLLMRTWVFKESADMSVSRVTPG
jgi:hypothetical protein